MRNFRPRPGQLTASSSISGGGGRTRLARHRLHLHPPGPDRSQDAAKSNREPKVDWAAITSAITALTAIGALVFTGFSLKATRDQVALAEQGQFTDRYSKAIEQLGTQGAESVQVRLGGIYALERLARDSPRDQPTITEVLSAFVRTNTQKSSRQGEECAGPPPVDIQTTLTVLGRRDPASDQQVRIDLRDTCLSRVDLSETNFGNADFNGANLTGAHLDHANLSGADLRNSTLVEAQLDFVDLHKANLVGASLVNASLWQANLTEVNAINGVDFTETYIDDANLDGAFLTGAILDRAHLAGATLVNAGLAGTRLSDAQLNTANLRQADLTGADLTNASLMGVNLRATNLHAADLAGTDLTNATHDARTRTDEVRTNSATKGMWW